MHQGFSRSSRRVLREFARTFVRGDRFIFLLETVFSGVRARKICVDRRAQVLRALSDSTASPTARLFSILPSESRHYSPARGARTPGTLDISRQRGEHRCSGRAMRPQVLYNFIRPPPALILRFIL